MEIAGNDALEKGVEVERKGLGTPATRVGIIENLIYKGFVERDKKNLIATHKGIILVTLVSDSFKSAETTAKWEMELVDIAKGKSFKERVIKGKIFSVRSNSFSVCLLRVKGKLTIMGVIFNLKLKFTPIIRTPRLPANKWILHGHGAKRMDIMLKIKLSSQS